MYKMKADGVVFYDPSSDDTALHVLNPKAQYELNKIDTLTFTMLPDNVLYDGFHKMTTIITLEQDDEVIFRGRVVETVTDKYNQKEVYCEGELSYLLDSLVRPYDFKGKAIDLFHQLLEKHNEQVDECKWFTPGIITAITDEDEVETESEAYASTLFEIRQMLVTKFKGYLRIRMENGVRYLDYIDEYDDECGQTIEFGVNLVDIENKIDAGDVFSVLVPLGGYNTSSSDDPITIKDVNDGKDYLEDAEAIAKYGRIVKTYKWEELSDPQEIKERGLEQFEKMKAARTITIRAVDLHIINTGVDAIRLGKKVRLISDPHKLNEPEICAKMELVIEKPDQTEYTFGLPPEALTDSNASANKKNNSNYSRLLKWIMTTENTLKVELDELNSQIILKADKIDLQGYVTMKDFEAVEGWTEDFTGVRVSASNIIGGHGDFDELWCGQLNGQSVGNKSQYVLTGINGVEKTSETITFLTPEGVEQSVRVLTNVTLRGVAGTTINYLGSTE